MNLGEVPNIICKGLRLVEADIKLLDAWADTKAQIEKIGPWVNKDVADKWGKKAACRVFHICKSGADVEITDPFAPGYPTEKPTNLLKEVPGAAKPVRTLFDVSQALSWVATSRKNSEERVNWQSAIPELVEALGKVA